MKKTSLFITVALRMNLILALLWILGAQRASAVAAPSVGNVEALNAPAAELRVCPSGCLYSSIQDAVDAASDGDVIKVAAGTYTNMNNYGNLAQIAYINKTVTIRGGYTTAFTDPPDPDANPTTLDAQGQGRVLYITGDIRPTIDGLRITGGDATGLGGGGVGRDTGGGVYVVNAAAALNNCQVYNNTAYDGGGLYLEQSDATLSGNTIANNSGSIGGGLYLLFSDATLNQNAIVSNTSALIGGGLLLVFSNATLSENTIASNTATTIGGGLYLERSDATIINNVVTDNQANNVGGGLHLMSSDAILINNVVADNQASIAGSGLDIRASSPHLLHTTIARNTGGDGLGVYITGYEKDGIYYSSNVWFANTILVSHTVGITITDGNTATLEATLWSDNTTDWGGAGHIVTGTINYWGNPAFVDPDAGDYHIGPGSAAVDTGVDADIEDDIDGDGRPFDGDRDGIDEFDIGADELVPHLDVAEYATPDPVQPGGQLTYTIRITNAGYIDLHAIVTDTLPISVTLDETSGGTLILPGGTVGITWTTFITAPDGVWMETIVVTVEDAYGGPLTNLVEVITEEGAIGKAIVIVNAYKVYLPLVLRSY